MRGFVNVFEWIFQGDSAAEFRMLITSLQRAETRLLQEESNEVSFLKSRVQPIIKQITKSATNNNYSLEVVSQ
jgi:hypothetical protein